MQDAIKIDPRDNVAVALRDLAAGATVELPPQRVVLHQAVGRGHKFALQPVGQNELVIKYGLPIGHATQPVAAGELIHSQNARTSLSDLDHYAYQPDFVTLPPQPGDREVQIYRRASGEVGIRNELWILPTVGCVNGIARQILQRFLQETQQAEDIDGAFLFSHTFGCSQLGQDHDNTRTMLQNMVRHPNAGAVLVIGLGCENNQVDVFRDTLGAFESDRVEFMVCQQHDDEVEAGLERLHALYQKMRHDRREPGRLSELKFGLECGGSDGLSGITANPLLGRFSDQMIANGGTTVLTEVPEMFGAEQQLMDRCENETVFRDTVRLIQSFKDGFAAAGQPVYENPSPGNKAGGITTLEEKSLGCTQKSGSAPVRGVLGYAQRLYGQGLHLVAAPGNDLVASTALALAGAQIVLFSTGRGTPFACPVPTMKLSSNSALAEKKGSWIDFDAGPVLEEESIEVCAERLEEMVLRVASGERVKAEKAGLQDIAILKTGVTL